LFRVLRLGFLFYKCFFAGGHARWILDSPRWVESGVSILFLEGLKAVLDHRRSVFVPELEQDFCAANGFHSPGAQKCCLRRWWSTRAFSRSFLNRFTRVTAESPSDSNIGHISSKACQTLPPKLVNSVVETLKRVRNGSAGLPSHTRREKTNDLFLRKALRWCDLLDGPGSKEFHAGQWILP
jgi:midasin